MLNSCILILAFMLLPTSVDFNSIDQQIIKKESSIVWWETAPPPKSRNQQLMPISWWIAVKEGSKKFGTNPFHIASVMDIEMNGWKSGPSGKGKNGRKFIGPAGFNRQCRLDPEIMYTPEKQIEWACKRLSGDFLVRIKKYNPKWRENGYLFSVISNAKRMEKEAKRILDYGRVG